MPEPLRSVAEMLGDRRGPDRDPQQRKQGAELLTLLRHQNVGGWSDDRWEQVRHFTGVPFVAIKAIMDLVGGATFQVVKRKKHKGNRTTFGPNGTVSKALPTAHAHARDDAYVPFDDRGHPLAKLADQPNPVETFGELATNLVLQNRLTGVAPMWAVPSASGKPVELWALKTPTTTPLYQQSLLYPHGAWRVQPYAAGGYGGMWTGSAMGGISAAGAILPGEEVRRWLEPHPFMELDGFSPLSATAKQLDVLEAIDDSRHATMENGISLNAVLIAPGMDDGTLARLDTKMNERHAGARNAGRLITLAPPAGQGPSDKTTLMSITGQSAKDMDYQQGWDQMVKFCLAVFGVPPSVAGLAGATSYSELYAALRQFHHRQGAFVHRLADWLTKVICRPYCEFSGQYRFQIDLPTLDDPDLMERQLGTDIPNGGVLYNEYRALRNRPTVGPEGDVPVSIYLKLLEAKLTPQPPAAPPQPGGDAAPPADAAQPDAQAPDPTGAPAPTDAQPDPNAPQDAPDDAQAANAPADGEDPLTALLGNSDAPDATGEPGAESAQPEGAAQPGDSGDETQDAVVRAALKAMGIEDDGEPVTKALSAGAKPTKPGASPKHAEGQKFQSGEKWFQIKQGRAVPTAAPGGAQAGKPQAGAAQPAANALAPDHAATIAAIVKYPGSKAFGFTPDTLAKMKPDAVHQIAVGLGIVPNAPNPVPPEQVKTAVTAGQPVPPAALKHAAKAVPAFTPAAKATLSSAKQWAHAQADKHVDKVVAHFGIPREKAHALLVNAITAVAQHASEHGKQMTATIRDPRTGKTATLTPTRDPRNGKPVAGNGPKVPIPKPTAAPQPAVRARPAPAKWEEIAGSAKPVAASKPAARGLLGRVLDHGLKHLGTPAEQRLAKQRIAKRTGSTPTGGAVPGVKNKLAKGTGVPRVRKAVEGGLVFGGQWEEGAEHKAVPKDAAEVVVVLRDLEPEDIDGLRVEYHPDGPKFWIDQMDWHEGVGGKAVIAAAEKATGEEAQEVGGGRDGAGVSGPAVFVCNEGPNPPGDGWVDLLKIARAEHKALAPDTTFVDPAPFGFCPDCREPFTRTWRHVGALVCCDNGHTHPREKAKYASTQVELTGEAKRKLLALGKQIAKEDLYELEGGLEADAHVTCLYGLHALDGAAVADVVRDFGPVQLRLGALRAFFGADTGKPYDVLYCEVDSPDLHRLRAALMALPHTLTHATYAPHATCGYLVAGTADKYLRELGAVDEAFTADALTFSTAAREHTSVPLTAVAKAFDESKVKRNHGEFASSGGNAKKPKPKGIAKRTAVPHPADGKTPAEIKLDLARLSGAHGGRDGNPWKISGTASEPATLNTVQDAVSAAQTKLGLNRRPKIADVYADALAALPDLTVGEFQSALVRLQIDGRVQLGAWTLAASQMPDEMTATAFPLDLNTNVYVEPKTPEPYPDGAVTKALPTLLAALADARGDEFAAAVLADARVLAPDVVRKAFDENAHPRDHGKFAHKGGKEGAHPVDDGGERVPDDAIHDSATDPENFEAWREEITDPGEWAKFEAKVTARRAELEGTPFFHGSPKPITDFANVTGRGISFTENADHAANFGRHVHEVRLDVKNPIDLTHLGSGQDEWDEEGDDPRVSPAQVADALAEHGVHVKFERTRPGFTSDILRSKMPEIIAQAKAKGYDAVQVTDYKDFEAPETVVFDPAQVRMVGRKENR